MESNTVTVEKHNVAPFFSVLLGSKSKEEEPCQIHETITKILAEECSDRVEMIVGATVTDTVGEMGSVKVTSYTISKAPSWAKGIEIKDLEHHVFVSFNVKDNLAFYFSEKGKKDVVREFFGKKRLPNLFPISIAKLNGSFINEDEIQMLWLSGIHGRDNFKADSKVLGGKSVADTLDPLIDQSYMMSAVRTEVNGMKSKSSVGINPFKSSIWKGPCKDWPTFEGRVLEILDTLSICSSESESPIGILSYPIPKPDDIEKPYDFALVDHEFLPEEDGQLRKELLKKLQYDFHAELVPTLNDSDIAIDIFHSGNKVGHVCVEVCVNDYKVNFNIKNDTPVKAFQDEFKRYKKVFKYPELIKCWFESGHAIVNGMVFLTGYQDVEYNKFLWAGFETYDVTKEKPGSDPKKPDLGNIGNEKSLFCWVQKCWSGNWLSSLDFNTTEKPQGWLYCDDGAGEKADFIHYVYHDGFHLISLIHVKASKTAKTSRKISVGAHDVVLNQAVKNLRYSSRKVLVEDLRSRHNDNKGCWFNGISAKASEFFDQLSSLKDNKFVKTRVVVVQPHTQKSVYDKHAGKKIKSQLDALLVSAENAIRSSGSEFYIIGVDDK
ncbi:hypothetical protein NM22_18430 [Vibrio tubiashii]|nr:hypothetical protein NM22_18430 [Vibrio tubiashii]